MAFIGVASHRETGFDPGVRTSSRVSMALTAALATARRSRSIGAGCRVHHGHRRSIECWAE